MRVMSDHRGTVRCMSPRHQGSAAAGRKPTPRSADGTKARLTLESVLLQLDHNINLTRILARGDLRAAREHLQVSIQVARERLSSRRRRP